MTEPTPDVPAEDEPTPQPEPEPTPEPTPDPAPSTDIDLSKITTPRTAAARDLPVMLAAVTAQRLQLEQLAAGGVDVSGQLTGLQLVELHLPSLVQYGTQLEGIAAGLSVLKSPPDISGPLTALAYSLAQLAAAVGQPPAVE